MRKKLKILFVSHELDPYSNGESKFIYNCAFYFLRKGNEVHLLAYGAHKDILEKGAIFNKIPRIIKRPVLFKTLFFILYISFKFKKKKYDLIHISGPVYPFPHHINTCQFVHSAYKRYIRHINFPILRKIYYILNYNIGSFIEKVVYKKSKKIIAVSNKIKRELIRYVKVKPERIEVIYNGVDPEEFPFKKGYEKEKLIRENDFLKGKLIFLFAGDIRSNRKGIESLIRAFKNVREDISLIVLGDPKTSPYPKLVKKLNLEDKVKFLGFKKNISFYYRAADFFVFPTYYEPFGIVILESLSSGTPVLASDKRFCGGTELIKEGFNGFIIKNPFKIKEIEKTIKKAIKNKEKLEELKLNSKESVKKVYFENIFKKYEEIYLKVI